MDVFDLRDRLIGEYSNYVRSFLHIRDERLRAFVEQELRNGSLWPEPLIQLNPSFEPGKLIDELVENGTLHAECGRIFRVGKSEQNPSGLPLRLHKHQEDAILTARKKENYILTTGTGSGKSLAYIIPIVDHILRRGASRGIQAIIVYPMNALANSQFGELQKFLGIGCSSNQSVRFARYTGQENDDERQSICQNPPDILLTNYVMLELLLTRNDRGEKSLLDSAKGLQFLVLDELHTYRGRQGADVAMLIRRTRDRLAADALQCVGTSATMGSQGNVHERRKAVADVGALLFGAAVVPDNVIGESLRRATSEKELTDPGFVADLTSAIHQNGQPDRTPQNEDSFLNDPLAIWIETTLGVQTEPSTGLLVRADPKSIGGHNGLAAELSRLTRIPADLCDSAIKRTLLTGHQIPPKHPGRLPPFAFRLHQFISRGDAVYTTLEAPAARHFTLKAQEFKPGDRQRRLFPLAFCRECGQEYHPVRGARSEKMGTNEYERRELNDQRNNVESSDQLGFLVDADSIDWPDDPAKSIERVPTDWLENVRGTARIRKNRQHLVPRIVRIDTDGLETADGTRLLFIRSPFPFCPKCGISYNIRQRSDISKLGILDIGGRSTATTILSLSAIRQLRNDPELAREARKLLSFTDNRQDASLQAGHFNDFVSVATLRAALHRAVESAGAAGIQHDELPQKLFDALALPLEEYAANPSVKYDALAETQKTLRQVLAHRVYRDLERGWRITQPNLEQCGLLQIEYRSLTEVCADGQEWHGSHPALANASADDRCTVARVLLDHMRRELAIKVEYLDRDFLEALRLRSEQRLIPPWAMDEDERPTTSSVLLPCPKSSEDDRRQAVYLSGRSGFGQYLRYSNPLQLATSLTTDDIQKIIGDTLRVLEQAGIVAEVEPARGSDSAPAYQILAAAFRWKTRNGKSAPVDPIRTPQEPEKGRRTNQFFVDFYRTVAHELKSGLQAREHTAQVDPAERQRREEDFRSARLPVLFCSPTMELGVDIAQLNLVNMRNVPPTPANYAQRSGRAGRSGQPALVITYCSTGSPHDQYFFNRQQRMVAGVVAPPRIDLTNEELMIAHLGAIWLAETGVSLGQSLRDALDLSSDPPSMSVLPEILSQFDNADAVKRAKDRSQNILLTLSNQLVCAPWYSENWFGDVFSSFIQRFDSACERWRSLYKSALAQYDSQTRIIRDASRSSIEKNRAEILQREAGIQMKLLLSERASAQSDFYSYRYFASEGFLPGYSFPRLPISAFVPARKTKDEFLSRPRFLAISEFGPNAIVYHEGSKYRIRRVILPPREGDEAGELPTRTAKLCPQCGYAHITPANQPGPDVCQHCQARLEPAMAGLFQMQNVSTRRQDRVNCDEEERMRQGYELRTALRFDHRQQRQMIRIAQILSDNERIGTLTYGQAATIFRINFGLTRRAEKNKYGFLLDPATGQWARADDEMDADGSNDDPLGPKAVRVIPYVTDTKNCLLFQPATPLAPEIMATLQAAMKTAIQIEFQLEDSELAAEPLPNRDDRKSLLFYEAAEGGAGVLGRLVDEADSLQRVARTALELCHFSVDGSTHSPSAPFKEECEAACYDCLMSYGNQTDHRILDRKCIQYLLQSLAQATVEPSPTGRSRQEHIASLLNQAGSELEKQWLRWLSEHGLSLPSRAQVFIEAGRSRPDFVYDDQFALIYIDGSPHDHAIRQQRDAQQQAALENAGFAVIRFHHRADWSDVVKRHPHVFGAEPQ